MAARSSEARRRRIAERGSDRLAYITGRIDSLPPPSEPVKPFDDETVTLSEPLISGVEDLRPHLPGQIEDFHEEDDAVISLSATENSSALPVQKCDASIESIGARNSNIRGKEQPHFSQRDQDSSAEVSSKDFSSPQLHSEQPFAFTLKELSNAIYASEITRRYCSIAIALLVVLSSPGFPLPLSLINFTRSIINFRPFYLLLFTNLTVVIARLISEKQRNDQGNRKGGAPSFEGQGLAVQVGNALEAGLVLQKGMEAMLMDFSVYTVIIVSGLSILRKFGF